MRIIGGKLKGRKIVAPAKLPVRPTTDFAKEALFNILRNEFVFSDLKILDVCAGTGNISYEFASRGVENILALDLNFGCVKFIQQTAKENDLSIRAMRVDAIRFLSKKGKNEYSLIFADPPYALKTLSTIPDLVFDNEWLEENGTLILEHGQENNFENHKYFQKQKKYGHVHFSFFEK